MLGKYLAFLLALGFSGATLAAGSSSSLSIFLTVDGKGITAISPSSCSTTGGSGSAKSFICQLSATTVPAGQPVTWTIIGGPDAAKFTLSTTGALAFGPIDVPVGDYSVMIAAVER